MASTVVERFRESDSQSFALSPRTSRTTFTLIHAGGRGRAHALKVDSL